MVVCEDQALFVEHDPGAVVRALGRDCFDRHNTGRVALVDLGGSRAWSMRPRGGSPKTRRSRSTPRSRSRSSPELSFARHRRQQHSRDRDRASEKRC